MNKITYEIRRYEDEDAAAWDAFLLQTVNGTFLQSRRFLSYHPAGRFRDCSLMIYDAKGNLAALCPGADQMMDGRRVFVSHPGSTFGGILVAPKHYKAAKVLAMLDALEAWWRAEGFAAVDLRITPSLFSKQGEDLLDYVLFHHHYKESVELSTYIDYDEFREPVEANFSQGKRTDFHNGQKIGMYGRPLRLPEELDDFYDVLCESLSKYGVQPVHSYEELLDFAQVRLTKECGFYGVFLPQEMGERMVAGAMMFYFSEVHLAHTQYLAAVNDYRRYSPMTFLCTYLIDTMRQRGFQKFSFGISTEERGRVLNKGLIFAKESYGSRHSVNRKFWKDMKVL